MTLRSEDNALRYRALRGAMTADLHAALVEHKPDIIFDFEERAAIREYDGGLDRAEAERLSAADVLSTPLPDANRDFKELAPDEIKRRLAMAGKDAQ